MLTTHTVSLHDYWTTDGKDVAIPSADTKN